jgi:cell wall-associated NlpC family hydrolase
MAPTGLYGNQTPDQYVASLYAPLQAQLSAQAQARLAAFQQLIASAIASTRGLVGQNDQQFANAINDTNNLARTSGEDLAAANPNASTQNMLAAINAPQAQRDAVAAQNSTVFNGGAGLLKYAGGVIPSTQMGEDAQARDTYLASLPSNIALTGLRGMNVLGNMATKEQGALSQQENSDRLKAIADNAAAVSRAQDVQARAQSTAFNQWATTQRLGQGAQTLKLSAARLNSEDFWRSKTYNLDVTKAQWQQANADRNYGLSYAKFQAAEKAAAARAARTGGVPASVASHAYTDMQYAYHGTPAKYQIGASGTRELVQGTGPGSQLTYQGAIKMAVAKYPQLGASGAIRLANNFYAPGEGGRPVTSTYSAGGYTAVSPKDYAQTTGATSRPTGADVAGLAHQFLGTPYVWGGNTPGKALDCSGFLQQAYRRVGINLPRTTYEQVKVGQPVGLNQLQPGDAIFTIPSPQGPKHVGMYVGNGQVQVSPETGDVNRIVSLKDYLSLGFVAARRYVG